MKAVPTLDFDNSAQYADIHLLSLMCWPDAKERERRMGTFGIDNMDNTEFEKLLDRIIRLSDLPDPKPETADRIIRAYSEDPSAHKIVWGFISNFADPAASDKSPTANFAEFIRICRLPAAREKLRGLVTIDRRHAFDELLRPIGGFGAAARGPALDDLETEIDAICRGHALLAGLVTTLIARCEQNHDDEFASSFNRACFVLDGMRSVQASTSTIKTAWPRWRGVAPLWAAAVVESGYQILNFDRVSRIIAHEDRRAPNNSLCSVVRGISDPSTGQRHAQSIGSRE